MKRTLQWIGVIATLAALAAGLYVLRAEPAAEIATTATGAPAAVAPALPPIAAPTTAATSTPSAMPAIPAFASDAERQSTRELRAEALPVFLEAADRQIAEARAALADLQRRGADAATLHAQEDTLQRLLALREQVLSRNADIAARR